ncbi:GGDEF domain-containing protein [Paenibacillus eucommiae]|nr:GGDEF domain-containing protein [Paenibacillus eucommiae]
MRSFPSPSYAQLQRQTKWIKWFMRTYWIVIAVHFAAQLLSFLLLPYPSDAHNFYYYILLYPTILMSAVTVLAQYIQHVSVKYSFYALFIAGTIISMYIIHLNMDIRIIPATILLPIVASTVFFRINLTLFTAGLQIIAFGILYKWDHLFRLYLNDFDLIAIPIFIIICTLVASIIIISGRELVNDLEATMIAKQELIAQNTMMSKLAKTDALTSLFNHISFHEFYEKALVHAEKGTPFHLALIDIDNFKKINDTYGHRTGDIVLSKVAQLIRDNMSPADIAARYGGEEFAVLLFEQTFEEAYKLMENMRKKIAQTSHEELGNRSVTVSIGLKSYSPNDTKVSLFEDVDALLYAAKRSSKNKTVTPFHPAQY